MESGEVTATFCGVVAVNAARGWSMYGGRCVLKEIGGENVDVNWSMIGVDNRIEKSHSAVGRQVGNMWTSKYGVDTMASEASVSWGKGRMMVCKKIGQLQVLKHVAHGPRVR